MSTGVGGFDEAPTVLIQAPLSDLGHPTPLSRPAPAQVNQTNRTSVTGRKSYRTTPPKHHPASAEPAFCSAGRVPQKVTRIRPHSEEGGSVRRRRVRRSGRAEGVHLHEHVAQPRGPEGGSPRRLRSDDVQWLPAVVGFGFPSGELVRPGLWRDLGDMIAGDGPPGARIDREDRERLVALRRRSRCSRAPEMNEPQLMLFGLLDTILIGQVHDGFDEGDDPHVDRMTCVGGRQLRVVRVAHTPTIEAPSDLVTSVATEYALPPTSLTIASAASPHRRCRR